MPPGFHEYLFLFTARPSFIFPMTSTTLFISQVCCQEPIARAVVDGGRDIGHLGGAAGVEPFVPVVSSHFIRHFLVTKLSPPVEAAESRPDWSEEKGAKCCSKLSGHAAVDCKVDRIRQADDDIDEQNDVSDQPVVQELNNTRGYCVQCGDT